MARIVFDVDIDAPAASVITALSTQDGIAAWWTDGTDYPGGADVEMTLRFPVAPVPFQLRVDEVGDDVVRWTSVGDFPPHWVDTTVAWHLTGNDSGGTTVHFVHDGWADDGGPFGSSALTWAQLQLTLKEHVETGAAVPHFVN